MYTSKSVPILNPLLTSCSRDTVRDKMQRDYISDPMYTFESANHASKACGPLVLWAIAQVNNHPINWACGPLVLWIN